MNLVVRVLATILCGPMLLIGAVWILQGIGLLKGAFMTGETVWAIIGVVCAVIGAAVLRGGRRVG